MRLVVPALGAARRLESVPRSGIREVLEAGRGSNAVDLAGGDPSFPTPEHIIAAAAEAAAAGSTHYTHGRGELRLREAIAQKLSRDNGIVCDPEREVIVTAGALNALAATFLALLDPGDEVLIADPAFANYAAQVALAGGVPVPVPLTSEWQLDVEAVREKLSSRTRAIVVNSPANPTGAVLERSLLEALAEALDGSRVVVVSDEAYEFLVYPPAQHSSLAALDGFADRTISVFSFSKTYAMTGWRLGYAVAPAGLDEALVKVQEHLVGCPSSVSQAAGLAALEGPREPAEQMLAEYGRRRELVVEALTGIDGVSLVAPAGAFYAFPRIDALGPAPARGLAEHGVLSVPGEAFGEQGRRHIRISYAGPFEQVERGLARLRDTIDGSCA
ncbi:MAG: pyridoxal phosphate-dependent aminotransferase [Gaiellaceae bacterium]